MDGGAVPLARGLVVHDDGSRGELDLGCDRLATRAARHGEGRSGGEGAPGRAPGYRRERAEARRDASAAQNRAANADRREERACREGAPGVALRSAEGGRAAAAVAAR